MQYESITVARSWTHLSRKQCDLPCPVYMSCKINVEKKVHTAGVSVWNGIAVSVVPAFGIC